MKVPCIILALMVGVILLLLIVLLSGLRNRFLAKQNNLKDDYFSSAVKAGNIIVWGYDVLNDRLFNITSDLFPPEGISPDEDIHYYHPDDRTPLLKAIHYNGDSDKLSKTLCVRMDRTGAGKWQYVEIDFCYCRGKNGKIITVVGTHRDVTDRYEIQAQLRESVQRMTFALENSNIVMWEYDVANNKFLSYNDEISDFKSEWREDKYIHMVHPDDKEVLLMEQKMMRDLVDETCSVDVRFKFKDGEDEPWHPCTLIWAPFVKDPVTGKILKYVGMRRDNTELLKLNTAVDDYARKINMICLEADIQVWEYDISNRTFKLTSGNNTQVVTADDIIHAAFEKDFSLIQSYIGLMDQKEDDRFTEQIRFLIKGRLYYTIINGIPVKNAKSEVTGYFGIRRDVTDMMLVRHRLEEEKAKAEQADKLKSAFLANVSHEIRTPLNAIVGFSDLLTSTNVPEEKEEFSQIISSNTNQLLNLINDILDLSKIESGMMVMRRFDFDFALSFNEFYKSFAQRNTNPNLKILCDNPYTSLVLLADQKRLNQIINNFTSNAMKYTKEGYIKMGYSYVNGGLKIYVEDTGIGVSEANKARIFQRFEKLDTFAQGTGLGLSICKAITDTCKGNIGFNSVEGKGSLFWAWLPIKKIKSVERIVEEDNLCD